MFSLIDSKIVRSIITVESQPFELVPSNVYIPDSVYSISLKTKLSQDEIFSIEKLLLKRVKSNKTVESQPFEFVVTYVYKPVSFNISTSDGGVSIFYAQN
jgi:hypothetical protein